MFIEKFTDEQILEIHLINENRLVDDVVYSDGIIGFIEIRTNWNGNLSPQQCIRWNGRAFGGLRAFKGSTVRYGVEVMHRLCLVRHQPNILNLDSDIYFDWYTESIFEDTK